MLVEDLMPLFADFGVLAVSGAGSALVILDMPGEEIFGGMQQSNEYAITYRSADLSGLAAGMAITVDGVAYKVRQTTPQEDGRLTKAMLKK